jgi:hypothetical protein
MWQRWKSQGSSGEAQKLASMNGHGIPRIAGIPQSIMRLFDVPRQGKEGVRADWSRHGWACG